MIKILKNNLLRIKAEKNYIFMVLIITVLTIFLAVYFTAKFEVKGNIALVKNEGKFDTDIRYLNIDIVKTAPKASDLVIGKYDAIATHNRNGKFDIVTNKGDDFKKYVEVMLETHGKANITIGDTRKVGTNILGYLTMFILMEGSIFMKFYSDDKNNGVLKRTLSSPVSMKAYLFAHCIFNFFMMYIPIMFILVVEKQLLNVNIGFSYFQYSYLLAILVFLSTAFGLFISSLIENTDDSMMMSNIVVILTSILGGSFNEITSKNGVVDKIVNLIPQKNYITLVQGIENNISISKFNGQLGYILGLSIVLFAIGIIICNSRYREGKY